MVFTMNFYLLSFIVILCVGPWITAREVYRRPTKSSVGATEETSKHLHQGSGFSLIKGLVQAASQARTWVQWLRRLLKALRKWCYAHPPEAKLGKCFANYFNIKIPGLRQYEKIARYNENLSGKEFQTVISKKFQFRRDTIDPCQNSKGVFKNFLGKHFTSLSQNFFAEVRNSLRYYSDVILSNQLVVCLSDYFWKKFWSWIDSAPDSHEINSFITNRL